jgi:hypothetical protein
MIFSEKLKETVTSFLKEGSDDVIRRMVEFDPDLVKKV